MKSSVTIALVPEIKSGPWIFWEDLTEGISKAAQYGFDAIELFVSSGNAIDPEKLKKSLVLNGLELSAVGTGAGKVIHGLTLSDAHLETRKKALDYVKEIISFGSIFNAPAIIGSMQGNAIDAASRNDSLEILAESLRELSNFAAERGTYLIYEPLNRYETNLLNSLAQGAEFIDQHHLEHVTLLADLFHMNIEENDLAKSLVDYAKYIGHIHFADSNRRPMGEGHTDMAAIAKAIQSINYPYFISAEAFPWPNPDAAAQKTIQTFNQYFKN